MTLVFRETVICAVCVAAIGLIRPETSRAETYDFVIQISVDGLRGDLLQDLIDTDTVGNFGNFKRFVDEGVTTFNARTDFTHTNTLPNHTSMLTGRPVSRPFGQPLTVNHGYISNSLPGPDWTLHNRGNTNVPYIASTFDVAHDNGLATGLYASKDKFVIFDQSYNAANGGTDTTGPDDGPDKIDSYVNVFSGSPFNASELNDEFITDMSFLHHNYSFVHYTDPDLAGHTFNWGSTGWNNSVRNVNGYLGDVFDLVTNDVQLSGHTAVILTADHGGSGNSHSISGNATNYTVPFFVWAPGLPAGADLYDLNAATRLDPGTGRPDYNAPVQPIRNGGGGNLALDLLGLGPIPGSSINWGQNLIVPEPTTLVLLAAGSLVCFRVRRGGTRSRCRGRELAV